MLNIILKTNLVISYLCRLGLTKMLLAFILSNHSIIQSGSSKKAEAAASNVTGIKGGSEKRKKDKTSG
jgi:hypothetical protein